jgi:L-ascorbate metabolism protein UlaG (beta-lactamase superfamily)
MARRTALRLTYLGAAGWIITDGLITVVLDPYLSRVRFSGRPYGQADASTARNDIRPILRMDAVPISDTAALDTHVPRADFILLSHSHFNHAMDMPYIARKTGATVIGTESASNVARAGAVPEAQILTVRGGEDYQFDGVGVQVIPSLHSALGEKRYFNAGIVPRNVTGTLKLKDYVEGGTLAYMVRMGGHEVLFFGSMNYIEREVTGLRPDVALVAAARPRLEIRDYTRRLLLALGRPKVVVATHWDDQGLPFGAPQTEALERVKTFVSEVKKASPRSQLVVPKHFETLILGPSGKVTSEKPPAAAKRR